MKLIIQNNRIAATATDDYTGPDEFIAAPPDFDVGRMGEYVYADGALTLEHVVPQQVARAQGKAALIKAGLWSGVLSFVAAIPGDTQRALAEVALHDTQHWQRNSPFLNAAKSGLGMTDEQLDALFVAAAQIEL